MRVAFYGRVSTEDHQDEEASRGWQLRAARKLIEPHGGIIVAEFFDVGYSRSLPWHRRPQATHLLHELLNDARGWEAVVVGEPHRAFYGNQFSLVFPRFVDSGVALWVPNLGRVDPDSEAHDMLMAVFGGMAKGERMRIKLRVKGAMADMAEREGRFLGGRPPYGYRLVDAGLHPKPEKAAAGIQLHRLEPDPITAPVVQRIFEEYLADEAGGRSLKGCRTTAFRRRRLTTLGAMHTDLDLVGPLALLGPSSTTPGTPDAKSGGANRATRDCSTPLRRRTAT
jgi:DNA invertase Pin-like site-specific DNA recombinase